MPLTKLPDFFAGITIVINVISWSEKSPNYHELQLESLKSTSGFIEIKRGTHTSGSVQTCNIRRGLKWVSDRLFSLESKVLAHITSPYKMMKNNQLPNHYYMLWFQPNFLGRNEDNSWPPPSFHRSLSTSQSFPTNDWKLCSCEYLFSVDRPSEVKTG